MIMTETEPGQLLFVYKQSNGGGVVEYTFTFTDTGLTVTGKEQVAGRELVMGLRRSPDCLGTWTLVASHGFDRLLTSCGGTFLRTRWSVELVFSFSGVHEPLKTKLASHKWTLTCTRDPDGVYTDTEVCMGTIGLSCFGLIAWTNCIIRSLPPQCFLP